MDAVRPEPRREPRVVLEDERAIGRDGRLEERRDDRLRLALGARREPDERARDRRRGENLGESRWRTPPRSPPRGGGVTR